MNEAIEAEHLLAKAQARLGAATKSLARYQLPEHRVHEPMRKLRRDIEARLSSPGRSSQPRTDHACGMAVYACFVASAAITDISTGISHSRSLG